MAERITNSLAGGEAGASLAAQTREIARLRRRLDGAAEACSAWCAAGHPPLERFLGGWSASRPSMGARDRRFLRRVLFRLAREAAALRGGTRPRPPRAGDDPLVLVASAFAMEEEEAPTLPGDVVRTVLGEILAAAPDLPWGRLPADWHDALVRAFGPAEAGDLVRVLNRPSESYDLRVNSARLGRDEAARILACDGLSAGPTPHAPDGLRLRAGRDVRSHRLYREGLVEIQDESSQLVALLALPPSGGSVFDACAGAGGKTLALAAVLRDRGRLDAYEIDPLRRTELRRRLGRAAIPSGVVRVLDVPPPDGTLYEAVLVDAPCSGSGTLRRAPHLLWRSLDLAARAIEQRTILGWAARHVRPGGLLVYATCSLFDEENASVARDFERQETIWRRLDPRPRLAQAGVRDPDALVHEGAFRVLPHRHGTDGMEAYVWVRTDA